MPNETINYEELFKLFCYDSMERPELCKPLKQKGFYAATDLHSVIYLPEDKVVLNFDEIEKPNVMVRVLSENKTQSTEINVAKLEELLVPDLIEEMLLVQEAEKCEECNGSGEVEWSYDAGASSNHKTFERKDDCPICRGTGESLPDRWVKTGKKIPDATKQFKMFGVGFTDKQLRRLITASKMIGAETITKTGGDTQTANIFKVNDFTILVMPTILADGGEEVTTINL